MSTEAIVLLCTCPDTTVAAEIATALVEERLAACVNRIPGVKSWYRWQGQVQQDEEVLLLIKTVASRFDAVAAAVRKLHPYEVPELIALPVSDGSADYLGWIAENAQP